MEKIKVNLGENTHYIYIDYPLEKIGEKIKDGDFGKKFVILSDIHVFPIYGEMVKKLVKKIFENFKLPYITITPTFSICPVHGYLPGEHFFCPKCLIKQPCEVYTRVVGYLRPVSQFNIGKQQEYKERKMFKIRRNILK
jgi:hypothetical protein